MGIFEGFAGEGTCGKGGGVGVGEDGDEVVESRVGDGFCGSVGAVAVENTCDKGGGGISASCWRIRICNPWLECSR